MDFITLSEAATLTGKTLITIRRLAKKPSSASYVQFKDGKLYIEKAFVSNKYSFVSTQPELEVNTQEPTQHTQPEPDLSTQGTQESDTSSTQVLIQALREQYESHIQDLKESLKSKEREIERLGTLFNQYQQIEMARATKLPTKAGSYEDAETLPVEPTPVAPSQPPAPTPVAPVTPSPEPTAIEPVTPEQPEPPKKKKWWQLF